MQTRDNAADVNIKLNLSTFGALENDRIAENLTGKREDVRREVMGIVSEAIVPDIARSQGATPDNGEPWRLSSNHTIDSAWQIDDTGGGPLQTNHQMDINFAFEGDRPMSTGAMLQRGKEQIASAVADSYVHSLEQRYHGKLTSVVDSDWKTQDGKLTDYRVQEAA
jgi:hypothetical protein